MIRPALFCSFCNWSLNSTEQLSQTREQQSKWGSTKAPYNLFRLFVIVMSLAFRKIPIPFDTFYHKWWICVFHVIFSIKKDAKSFSISYRINVLIINKNLRTFFTRIMKCVATALVSHHFSRTWMFTRIRITALQYLPRWCIGLTIIRLRLVVLCPI